MSLGVLIRGPEGLVFAAESRVTLEWKRDPTDKGTLCDFDTANKLLTFRQPYNFVGAVTFGRGAIGNRTAYSYIPDIEASLPQDPVPVQQFAKHLYEFFMEKWPYPVSWEGGREEKPDIDQMKFIVGGYAGEHDPIAEAYEIWIPGKLKFDGKKWIALTPTYEPLEPRFGINYGGVSSYTDRLFKGYDLQLSGKLCKNEELALGLEQKIALIAALEGVSINDAKAKLEAYAPAASVAAQAAAAVGTKEEEGQEKEEDEEGESALKKDISTLEMPVPLEAMALQDYVDLAILLVRTTIEAQRLTAGGRGCGGPIDVVTISPYVGVKHIQQKNLEGERTLR